MTIAYLTTPLLGLVDIAVVGRLGVPAVIGGLAIGAIIIDLVASSFNFLRSGTTGLTAQALGSEDTEEIQAILLRAVGIGLAFGGILILLGPVIVVFSLWAMAPGSAVSEAAATYVTIRILASPFTLANYSILGWLIGIGRTNTGLAIQLLLGTVNICLSLTLGLWYGWGLYGVAVATVISEIIASLVGAAVCWKLLMPTWKFDLNRILDRMALSRLLRLNTDLLLRTFALLFAFAFFTAQGAKYGEVTLAGNAILMQFFMIAGFFLDGLATAAEQLIGRAIGANYRAGFVKGFRLSFFWNVVLAAGLSLLFYIFGAQLIDVLTVSEPVRLSAKTYLIWAVLIPLTGVAAFQMDGVFIGATWSREMSKMMIISLAVYLGIWWITRESLGNHGLWLSLHCFLLCRGITLASRLRTKFNEAFPDAVVR